jgi:hypothetical protein
MAMLLLIMIALPGADADATDLVGKDQTIVMTHLWPEPRPRQGRVLNTYTPLTDSNIKAAANLWVSDKAAATLTYGLVSTWDVSKITTMYSTLQALAFNDNINNWNVGLVTNMENSKSRRILENELT